MVAYGLEIVVVGVAGVVDSDVLDDGSGGGTIWAALSVGVDDVALLELASVVVLVDVDVGAGGVVVRGAEYDVVRGAGLTGADGCWRELWAVWMTA